MKKFYLIIAGLLLWTLPLDALTIDDAVKLAIENNHRIREYRHLSEAQRQRVGSRKSAFMPELNLSYSFARRDKDVFFQTRDSSVFSAEVAYNLFNGFMDIRKLKATESLLNASLYQQRAVEVDVVLEVKKAYTEVLRAKRNLEIAKEAVQLLQRQRRDALLYYREGLIAKNELLKVDVELASAQQGLIQAESALNINRKALERIMGVGIQDEVIEEIEEDGFPELNEDELVEEMLQRRSELGYLRGLKKFREYSRDSIRGEYLPAVDLSLTHERYGDSVMPDGRNDLYDTETRAMIVAKWNLFDGFRKRHDIGAEDAEIRAIEEQLKDTEEEMKLQLRTALENYQVAVSKLEVSKKAVEHSEENYRITENRFRQRMATTTDLLDARFLLTRAQTEHSNALYDIFKSIAEVERVVERDLENRD